MSTTPDPGRKTSELTARALAAGDKVIVATVAGDNVAATVGDDVSALQAADSRTDNPHAVTKDQVGLGSVDNTSDLDKPIGTLTQTALDALSAADSRTDNPHAVTKEQVGLGSVNNTSDLDKPISTLTQTALDAINVANVASLASITPANGSTVVTQGYYTVGDGGGNVYKYDSASSDTIDGGFVIDGPGSVGRFLAIDQTVANVRHFGATGDGVTDDTSHVQSWLDVGGKLWLSEGVYRCQGLTSSVDVSVDGSPGAVIKLVSASSSSLLTIGGAGSRQIFSGVEFDGAFSEAAASSWSPTLDTNNDAIESLTFRECRFTNIVRAVNIYRVTHKVEVTSCRFEGGKAHTGTLNEGTIFLIVRGGESLDEQTVRIANNVFVGLAGSHIGGVLITRDTGTSSVLGIQAFIDSNSFYECGQDIGGNAAAAIVLYRAAPYSNITNNNVFGGAEKGIDVQGSSSPTITGNYIQGVVSNGIELASRDGDKVVDNGSIVNNTLESIGGTAMSVSGAPAALLGENVTISGNVVKGCERFILVADMQGHASITDNNLSGSTETSSSQDLQCIAIVGSRSSGAQAIDLSVTFQGNRVSESSTALRVDELTGSVIIANNVFSSNAANKTVVVVNCTGIIGFRGNHVEDSAGSLLVQLSGGPVVVAGNTMKNITGIRGITLDTVTGLTSMHSNQFIDCSNDLVAYDAATGANQSSDNMSNVASTLRKVNGSVLTSADNINIT